MMELTKYLVETRSNTGGIILGYQNGLLHMVDIQTPNLEEKQVKWIWNWVPMLESDAMHYKNEKIWITKMAEDLSFEAFWNKFDYKIGKKERAENLWKALRTDEKGAALKCIPKYKHWIATQNIKPTYPETWLSQRRWENEFKI